MFQTVEELFLRHDRFASMTDARHERLAVVRIMLESQGLTLGAENDLLLGHEAGKTYGVNSDLFKLRPASSGNNSVLGNALTSLALIPLQSDKLRSADRRA